MAADKDIISLQRDLALVDNRIRTLQQSTDKKLLALTALLQHTLQRLSEINTDNAALCSSYIDETHRQERVLEEVHTIGAKVDRMTAELRATRDIMADSTTRLRHTKTSVYPAPMARIPYPSPKDSR